MADEDPCLPLIGASVRKNFKGYGWYNGVVVSYDPQESWYTVRYIEDGELEEYSIQQLRPLLAHALAHAAAAAAAPQDGPAGPPPGRSTLPQVSPKPKRAPPKARVASPPRVVRRRRGGSSADESAPGSSSDASDDTEVSVESSQDGHQAAPWEDGATDEESEPEEEPESEPEAEAEPVIAPKASAAAKGKAAAKPKPAKPVKAAAAVHALAPAGAPLSATAAPKKKKSASKAAPKPALPDGPAAAEAVKVCLQEYQKSYLLATRSELERVNAAGGVGLNGKRLSQRPDLVALNRMLDQGTVINQTPCIGHVPGIPIGRRLYGRAELMVIGLHHHWLNGISYVSAKDADKYGHAGKSFSVSIIVSGGYEDDQDDGVELEYTGQGGNDLLGNGRQLKDQTWDRGNLALKNNVQLGIPVRVTRGNPDKEAVYGKVFIYDGLYDVYEAAKHQGISGFVVIKFKLRRRASQPPLSSSTVTFGHASLPRGFDASRRVGLVDDDISGGLERLPVVAVNDVDDALPPCTKPSKTLALKAAKVVSGILAAPHLSEEALRQRDREWRASLRYTARLEYAPNVAQPPMLTVGCACTKGCTDDRTCACAKLNPSGQLPYVVDRNGRARLNYGYRVIHECGPACACPPSCPNRVTQQGLKFRLEVFRTPDGRGWGVRSWDSIPAGAYIASFFGTVITDEDAGKASDVYLFNMRVPTNRPEDSVQADDAEMYYEGEAENHFCIDANSVGGVARFINHSCAPNVFVQTVLGGSASLGTGHRDDKQAMVNLFAMDNIPPLTELGYDYGPQYVEVQLGGKCMCAADTCANKAAALLSLAGPSNAAGASGVAGAGPRTGPFRLPSNSAYS